MQRAQMSVIAPLLLILVQANAVELQSGEMLERQMQSLMAENDLPEPAAPARMQTAMEAMAAESGAAVVEPTVAEPKVVAQAAEPTIAAVEPTTGQAHTKHDYFTQKQKTEKLVKLLVKSSHSNKALVQKMEVLKKELNEAETNQEYASEISGQKLAKQEVQTLAESQRAAAVEKKLEKVSHEVKLRKMAMKKMGHKLQEAKQQMSAVQLKAVSAARLEASEKKLVADAQNQLESERRELAEAKAELSKLSAVDKKKDHRANVLRKQAVTGLAMRKQNMILKRTLVSQVKREGQLREKVSKTDRLFNMEVQKERDVDSKLQKARIAFQQLHKRTDRLSAIESKIEQSQHAAEDAAAKAQVELLEAQAENKQLEKKSAWLKQVVIGEEHQAAQKATMQLQDVLREQDALQVLLAQGTKPKALPEVVAPVRDQHATMLDEAAERLQDQFADVAQMPSRFGLGFTMNNIRPQAPVALPPSMAMPLGEEHYSLQPPGMF